MRNKVTNNHPPTIYNFRHTPRTKICAVCHKPSFTQNTTIMADERNLSFIRTLSVAEFKRQMNITKVNIIKNPKTDNLFFQGDDNSDIRGAVSKSFDASDTSKLVMSEVAPKTGPEAGVAFWMLHVKNESDNLQLSL